jgi:hypothetical protein
LVVEKMRVLGIQVLVHRALEQVLEQVRTGYPHHRRPPHWAKTRGFPVWVLVVEKSLVVEELTLVLGEMALAVETLLVVGVEPPLVVLQLLVEAQER